MTNEYGERLDRNGYAPSILTGHGPCTCWACGKNGCMDQLDRHEIFGGPMRQKSKRLGLWAHLCHSSCHLGGVHCDAELDRELKQEGQRTAMETYGWNVDEFRRQFGKNYL